MKSRVPSNLRGSALPGLSVRLLVAAWALASLNSNARAWRLSPGHDQPAVGFGRRHVDGGIGGSGNGTGLLGTLIESGSMLHGMMAASGIGNVGVVLALGVLPGSPPPATAPPEAGSPSTRFSCDYLGETPPGDEPQVFGRGTVSVDGRNTHAVQFSPNGRMLVFSRYPDGTSYVMRRGQDGWSQPAKTSFTGKEVTFDATTRRLFYYDRGGDLFWVEYNDEGFSAPTRLGANINTREVEYYPSITARGNLFFSRNSKWDQGRLMVARPAGEDFAASADLGDLVNAGGASHGFVAPDESYLLFNSPRTGSTTKNDIWISFREADGAWSAPVNLGSRINCDAMAVLCPTVSPDGKFLFFTRLQDGGTGLVHWVSTRVINEARRRAAERGNPPNDHP